MINSLLELVVVSEPHGLPPLRLALLLPCYLAISFDIC